MNMKDIRDKAKGLEIKIGIGVTKADAIRQIQIAEGYEDCFGRGKASICGQDACCFRSDCEKIPA